MAIKPTTNAGATSRFISASMSRHRYVDAVRHVSLIAASIPLRSRLSFALRVGRAAQEPVAAAARRRPREPKPPPGVAAQVFVELRGRPGLAAVGRNVD